MIEKGQMIRKIWAEIDFMLNEGSGFQRDLASVGSVYLISVKSGGIMGGSDHHACGRGKVTDRKTEHGRWLEPGIDPDINPHFSENCGSQFGKITRMDPAVTAYGAGGGGEMSQQIGTQSQRCLHDRKDIHTVGSRSENAPEPAGPERKVTVKTVLNSGVIHGTQFQEQFFGHAGVMQPGVVFFRHRHINFLS
jgi:hypothetical protein